MPHCHSRRAAPIRALSQSPAQREQRYEQIVAAATTLAGLGDVHCQIRSVATAAGMAPSTVYRYFASKDELLLACLHRWLRDFSVTAPKASAGEIDSYTKVLEVAKTLTASMCMSPRFTAAVIRPYLYARGAASNLAARVRQQLIDIFCAAMGDGQSSQPHYKVAEILTDVWVSNVVGISQHRTTIDDLMYRFASVVGAAEHMRGDVENAGASEDAGRFDSIQLRPSTDEEASTACPGAS